MKTNQNKTETPDYLVFQAVQCTDNYSEWDVRQMYSCLSNREQKLLERHLKQMTGSKTNDRIIRAIAIIQDMADLKEKLENKRKIEITEINPKGKQKVNIRFIS